MTLRASARMTMRRAVAQELELRSLEFVVFHGCRAIQKLLDLSLHLVRLPGREPANHPGDLIDDLIARFLTLGLLQSSQGGQAFGQNFHWVGQLLGGKEARYLRRLRSAEPGWL